VLVYFVGSEDGGLLARIRLTIVTPYDRTIDPPYGRRALSHRPGRNRPERPGGQVAGKIPDPGKLLNNGVRVSYIILKRI